MSTFLFIYFLDDEGSGNFLWGRTLCHVGKERGLVMLRDMLGYILRSDGGYIDTWLIPIELVDGVVRMST